MTVSRRLFPFVLVATILSATGLVLARPQAQATPPAPLTATQLAQKLPTDPDTTTGTYPNGLRYYVRKNALPEKRAELRLVVNAGSLLEEDDQQGLAHFVEHMAFNGTKNFPKNEMVSFMESIGMKFGAHVNAYTSFDETVYTLQIPTDKPAVIDRALLILDDWARNVTFDSVEVNKERGVIMEEWRLRRGAQARMQDLQFPVLLKGSRYADRIPIGKTDVLQNFKVDRLKQFYTDWYRPDLMGVIAVGDFDKPAMEALLKKHFAAIPPAAKPKPRPVFEVPKQPGTLFSIATDPEATMATVSAYSKMAFRDPSTFGAYRQQIVERLFSSMLSARLTEMGQKVDAPFLGAGSSRGIFVKSAEASTLSALAKEDAIDKALEALFTETERVTRFGFTASELDREKTSYLRIIESAMVEIGKRPSGQLADELVRNFTQAEPFPGLIVEVDVTRRVMPTITLGEVNGLAKEWMPEGNRVVLVNAPQKPTVKVPDEAALMAAIKAATTKTLTPYADAVSAKPFFSATPRTGTIAKTTVRADVGITEWVLSNGVKVVIKPTTFKEDEVVFQAFSPGGTSLAADDELIWAEPAATLIGESGVGEFNRTELRKMLTDKIAGVSPYIGDLDEGLNGTASVKDLETMFQLIYLRFTAPRADTDLFTLMKTQARLAVSSMRAQPMGAFQEAITEAMTQNHPRARTPTPEMIDRMDLDRSMAFYKDRFADAGDFTFVFVGTIDPARLKPLVEKYLASLPTTGRKETWKDRNVQPPSSIVERRVEKGLEPQSHTRITFTGPIAYNQQERIAIRAVAAVLQTRLREVLREELGGTYSVAAQASYEKYPKPEYSFAVDFGSSPARTEELVKRVFAEIEAFKASGPTAQQLADAKEAFIRDHETNIKDNDYLLSQISTKYEYGEEGEIGVLFDLASWYQKLTVSAVQDAAKRYLNTGRYVKVSLFPEKK
jgi:zinc protease